MRRLCGLQETMLRQLQQLSSGGSLAAMAYNRRTCNDVCGYFKDIMAAAAGMVPVSAAKELFEFLRHPPRALSGLLREPTRNLTPPEVAWQEPSAHPFCQLSALIQDVWEHVLGPEAAVQECVASALGSLYCGVTCDFGAGAGFYAMKMARRGKLICVERSLIKRIYLRFCAHRSGRVLGRRCCRTRLDTVLAINVLDHVRRPGNVVECLARRLKPGGMLAVWAAFPQDGWHTAGTDHRRAVQRSLSRWFEPSGVCLGLPELMYFRRRTTPVPFVDWHQVRQKSDLVVRLDPAAALKQHPNVCDHLVLFSRRPYSDVMVVARDARAIVEHSRQYRTVAEICREARRFGIVPAATCDMIRQMGLAGLLVCGDTSKKRFNSEVL